MAKTVETKKDAKTRALRSSIQNVVGVGLSLVLLACAGVVTDVVEPGQVVDLETLLPALGGAVVCVLVAVVVWAWGGGAVGVGGRGVCVEVQAWRRRPAPVSMTPRGFQEARRVKPENRTVWPTNTRQTQAALLSEAARK